MASMENHLIELLPRADRTRLLSICKPVDLVLAEVLYEPRRPIRHVYFPITGFVSLVMSIDGNPGLEIGMVGREGMVGSHLILGVVEAPLHALVQGAGTAWRVAVAPFRRQLDASPALRRGLNRYLYVLMAQMAESAGCLRYHEIGPRLARWLLMSQDRAHCDEFAVTQEFLAYMLGVRRVGVTKAAGALQSSGLIHYRRGLMTVTDRAGLMAAACSCYAVDCKTYLDLLGPTAEAAN